MMEISVPDILYFLLSLAALIHTKSSHRKSGDVLSLQHRKYGAGVTVSARNSPSLPPSLKHYFTNAVEIIRNRPRQTLCVLITSVHVPQNIKISFQIVMEQIAFKWTACVESLLPEQHATAIVCLLWGTRVDGTRLISHFAEQPMSASDNSSVEPW